MKLFKWIYRLGVLHERNRIKKLLAEFALEVSRQRHDFMESINTANGRPSVKPSEELATNQAALSLIGELLEPRLDSERTAQAAIDKD